MIGGEGWVRVLWGWSGWGYGVFAGVPGFSTGVLGRAVPAGGQGGTGGGGPVAVGHRAVSY